MSLVFKNFYGRVGGHLSQKSKDLLTNALPKYQVFDDFFIDIKQKIDTSKLTELNLEIGSGSGDFIFNSAKHNPNNFYIAVEVFLNGIASLLEKMESHPLNNLKIYNSNVYNILSNIEESVFDNVYILFPDPWPKKKHHKRRIINTNNLDIFHKIIKPNGRLRFVSDHQEYSEYALEHLLNYKKLKWSANSIEDAYIKPQDHFETKYERKAKAVNSKITYLDFYVVK